MSRITGDETGRMGLSRGIIAGLTAFVFVWQLWVFIASVGELYERPYRLFIMNADLTSQLANGAFAAGVVLVVWNAGVLVGFGLLMKRAFRKLRGR